MTSTPGLSPEILNEVQSFLASRNIVAKLMSSCEGLVREMKVQVRFSVCVFPKMFAS